MLFVHRQIWTILGIPNSMIWNVVLIIRGSNRLQFVSGSLLNVSIHEHGSVGDVLSLTHANLVDENYISSLLR